MEVCGIRPLAGCGERVHFQGGDGRALGVAKNDEVVSGVVLGDRIVQISDTQGDRLVDRQAVKPCKRQFCSGVGSPTGLNPGNTG